MSSPTGPAGTSGRTVAILAFDDMEVLVEIHPLREEAANCLLE